MGTTARADLEGLAALRRQTPGVLQQQRRQPLSDAPRGAVPLPPLPDAAEVLSSLVALATDREKQASLREETKDLLRRTPKGLETPKYAVVRTLDGPGTLGAAELRAYEPFTVARTSMRGSGAGAAGEGFNTLAAYLFGKNERAQSMAMTMPVQTAMRDADGACAQPSSMAFVLPARFADAPPAPLASSGVRIDTVPARLVAVQEHAFQGLCEMIKLNPRGVIPHFVHLCDAIASWQTPPAELDVMFRQILTGYKSSVAPDAWAQYYATFPDYMRVRLTQRYGI